MKIVMASSEVAPFAKTGGLADMVAGLSSELAKMGHEVVMFMPFFRQAQEAARDAQLVPGGLRIPVGPMEIQGDLRTLVLGERLMAAFVVQPSFYDRPTLYGPSEQAYGDNAERFIFFSKAVVEGIRMLRIEPDVLHTHDWHAAMVPLWWRHVMGPSRRVRSVFTIHNLAYQGLFPPHTFELTNLPRELFATFGLEFYGQVSMMKAGLLYSDVVNTVSPQYAEEIRTKEFGYGLEGLLSDLGPKLCGVLNGVDYNVWSPEHDPFIAANYSQHNLAGKTVCKRALLANFKLPAEREQAPLIGVVSRLTAQKGFDLIADAVPELVKMDATLVVLGTGDPKQEAQFQALRERYPNNVGIHLGFNNPLAHQIEAGSDLFLMPSRFEPCGLNQMYSLRYGTIPVVRNTGGLANTVKHYNPNTMAGTGFSFVECSSAALIGAMRAALGAYRQPQHWSRLIQNAMASDFSWRRSAERYIELYQGNR